MTKKAQRSHKRRQLRRNLREGHARLLDRTKAPAESQKPLEKPEPKSGNLSFEKGESGKALYYEPQSAPGDRFTDPRGKSYEIGPSGQLKALNKPRSRVKGQREERAQQKQKKAGGMKT